VTRLPSLPLWVPPQAHPSSTRDMGLQGRTASGYTGEALPAQANWAGKTRCWLVCHALCSHPPDLSFVVAAMHLACASTAMLSPFHVVPCSWGVDASRIEIRTPCEGTGMYLLYVQYCTPTAAVRLCFSQLPPQPQGYASRSAVPTVAKWASHCRSTSRRLVRKFQTARSTPCAWAKPAGSVEHSSEPCFLASLPCKTSSNCSSELLSVPRVWLNVWAMRVWCLRLQDTKVPHFLAHTRERQYCSGILEWYVHELLEKRISRYKMSCQHITTLPDEQGATSLTINLAYRWIHPSLGSDALGALQGVQ